MSAIRTILVPVDFSSHAEAALKRALDLAHALDAKLHLLHSYAFPVRGVMPYEMAVPAGVWDSIRDATIERLEALRAEVEAGGVVAEAEGSADLPTEAIRTAIERRRADLVVMGTRGNTGLKHVLLGSVAERTIRTASCPVLAVKEEEKALGPIGRIVVADDFSTHANRALELAIDLAKPLGARIDLVHAFDVPIPIVTPYEIAIPDDLIEEARDAAARKLDKALQKVSASGVEVESHLTEVPAAPAIARVAKELGADLIAMGTRGNTGLKHVLIGSVAERTLRMAHCSVLTVHRPEE